MMTSNSKTIMHSSPNKAEQGQISKTKLEELLNSAMTQLHSKFANNPNPQIQQAISRKLAGLKLLVGTIEKRCNGIHVTIDRELDEKQRKLDQYTNKAHLEIEREKEEELMDLISQFRQWVNKLDQHQPPPPQPQPPQPPQQLSPISHQHPHPHPHLAQVHDHNMNANQSTATLQTLSSSATGNNDENVFIVADENGNIINTFKLNGGQSLYKMGN